MRSDDKGGGLVRQNRAIRIMIPTTIQSDRSKDEFGRGLVGLLICLTFLLHW